MKGLQKEDKSKIEERGAFDIRFECLVDGFV